MLLLSRPLKIEEAQDEGIAIDFCAKIDDLISTKKYSDEIIIQSVNAVLSNLPITDEKLKGAIKRELSRCFPDIKWTFDKKIITNNRL